MLSAFIWSSMPKSSQLDNFQPWICLRVNSRFTEFDMNEMEWFWSLSLCALSCPQRRTVMIGLYTLACSSFALPCFRYLYFTCQAGVAPDFPSSIPATKINACWRKKLNNKLDRNKANWTESKHMMQIKSGFSWFIIFWCCCEISFVKHVSLDFQKTWVAEMHLHFTVVSMFEKIL